MYMHWIRISNIQKRKVILVLNDDSCAQGSCKATKTRTNQFFPSETLAWNSAELGISTNSEIQYSFVSTKRVDMIVYACICRASDTTVLCETTTPGVEGNFAQVSLQLLQVLHDIGALEDETRRTFVHDSGENDLSSGDILDASDAKKMNCSPGSGMESLFNGTAPLGEKNDLSQVFFHCAVYHGVIYLSVTDGAGLTSK